MFPTSLTSDRRSHKQALTAARHGATVRLFGVWKSGLDYIEDKPLYQITRLEVCSGTKIGRYFRYCYELKRQFNSFDPDVLHIHSPVLLPLVILFGINKTIVYDCHEFESEKTGLGRFQKFTIKILEQIFSLYVDRIFVVSEDIKSEYSKRYRFISHKLCVLPNVPPYQRRNSSDYIKRRYNLRGDSVIFVYQGYLCRGRGIEEIVGAARCLSEKRFVVPQFLFIGYGPLETLINDSLGLGNIHYHPKVGFDELNEITSSCDFGFNIPPEMSGSRKLGMPNKLFEYVMARIPVIVTDDVSRAAFVRRYKVGEVLVDRSISGLVELILRCAESNTKEKYSDQLDEAAKIFCWENFESRLLISYNLK